MMHGRENIKLINCLRQGPSGFEGILHEFDCRLNCATISYGVGRVVKIHFI